MRVCFFISNLLGGGAQRQLIGLVNELQHTPRVEVHLILLGSGVLDDQLDVSRLKLHRIEVPNFASPRALAFAVWTLRRVRPDILVSWLHPADIWSFMATRVVRGVPWVMAERSSDQNYKGRFHPEARRAYAVRRWMGRRGPDAIIANSQAGKEFWEAITKRVPVQVIPNMVIPAEAPLECGTDRPNSVECLFVGRLDPEKNVGTMTSWFASFARGRPEAKLILAGTGAQAAEVVLVAEREGVANRVELLGFRNDVPSLMGHARVLLSFGLFEGMPNVLIEAITAGTPAVVSDIPEHHALLGDDYPYYVRLESSPEEAARVITLAWDQGLGADERFYAYARALLTTMTPEKIARAYLDAFATVLACADSRSNQKRATSRFVRPG